MSTAIKYLSKTIGNPVPCWKIFAVETSPSGESRLIDGFTDFALHPHEALRLIANKVPEFSASYWFWAEEKFPKLERDFWVHVDILGLTHDSKQISMKDGQRELLVSASLGSGKQATHYRLYIQKATAQPLYQIHVEG